MTTELATIVTPASPVVSPEEFTDAIENARTKASILADIVEEQELYTIIQGKKHLHVEAWKTIGKGYGLSPQIEWTRPIETGGWEARCIFTDLAGEQVGRAGRNCLDWVVVLAGFSATPFEEMPREHGEHPLPSGGPRFDRRPPPSAPSVPSADREIGEFCELHQINFFKAGRMKSFAHPLEGEKDEKGYQKWCNYKPAPPPEPEIFDDLSDIGDEQQA